MTNTDLLIFSGLFKQAYQKCFGHAIGTAMTETESRIMANQVNELTGLSVGWKSIKNYSFFVLGGDTGKPENPSAATLDTLARYVLGAPYTTELKRKDNESHYPYWFMYRKQFQAIPPETHKTPKRLAWSITGLVAVISLIVIFMITRESRSVNQTFYDNFNEVSDAALQSNNWLVQAKDNAHWHRKNEKPKALTLFTLEGDNWPDTSKKPVIQNLLLHPIKTDCFTAEVHLDNFIPKQEWQQAGLLLLEDTSLTGKSIRLSLAYNDFFGGYKRPREILVQAITSLGPGFGKPEEIAHHVVFYPDSAAASPALFKNLLNSALRIEKNGSRFRFLYAGGEVQNTAFKEVASQDFDMTPRYIGLFAIKGFKNETEVIPVHFKFFRLQGGPCQK
ncbi:hypothetical protein [Mucilaginibacter celer]|uniref:Uncharacterized protein n=1 Tax=Mucilaginibacter celer TaxID=2305508 RepID=A0A494VQM2_9SPHI|nr:hypothetical protein [Mucilaginibacter celer]AYL96271.1 hypothetical protein HYN43_013635 [Mucilaginibacter celer]